MYKTTVPETQEGLASSGHGEPPSEADLGFLLRGLQAMAHEKRLRILALLAEGEMCVCDLTEGLGISQPLASHHLRVLKEAGLVRDRRDAQWVYYRLDVDALRRFHAAYKALFNVERIAAQSQLRGARSCAPKRQARGALHPDVPHETRSA
ncbi:MAG: ArsR/SmtB family transcription factor [Anaerolineae bacterium]